MLTSGELNSIQGLLKYLNENLNHIGVEDITVVDENAEPVAVVGTHGGDYVLKRIY